ncbi:hypothetical protein FQ179_01985 [Pusillimonas sp. ANT_WB101]|nr:hypothetical protein FQ179_01985 [Pusillimonas sp. ANT_WB101]
MKYAHEVLELLAPYPGRQFRMAEIVRYVDPGAKGVSRQRVHKGVLRVLKALEENDHIEIQPAADSGGFARYSWKARHQVIANRDRNHDNIGRTLAS